MTSPSGTLRLVATPIGNLRDLSSRAFETLRDARAIACEDTRVTRKLLAAYHIPTPAAFFAFHEHNEDAAARRIVRLLHDGVDVALCSDAGTPALSDPGYRAVVAALEADCPVEAVPGACAALTALTLSGLPTATYTFLGFGPRGPGRLRHCLAAERLRPHTLVLYESPRRLGRLLAAARDALGDRRAAVALELTKKFERVQRGWLADLAGRYADAVPPGEATVVIAGHHPKFMRGAAPVPSDGVDAPVPAAGVDGHVGDHGTPRSPTTKKRSRSPTMPAPIRLDHPLQFRPILQERVWGGERLRVRLPEGPGVDSPSGPIGEAWELVDRDDAQSVVRRGPLAGRTLRELFAADRDGLCGRAFDPANPAVFPLILKLLDAREDLSVQVHPDDARAARARAGELGKTEAWYVLEAEPGAVLYRGLAPGVDAAAWRKALDGGDVAASLNRCAARPGDVFHLPAGTVHALGAGVRIAEIQQNSDTTYRVFDWNRVGLDGRPRTLHVDDAFAATDFRSEANRPDADPAGPSEPVGPDGARRAVLVRDGKFGMERFDGAVGAPSGWTLDTGRAGFHLWLAAQGTATLRAEGVDDDGDGRVAYLESWDSALIPAAVGRYTVAASPGAVLLRFTSGR